MFGNVGFTEILIIVAVISLFFGPSGVTFGKAIPTGHSANRLAVAEKASRCDRTGAPSWLLRWSTC